MDGYLLDRRLSESVRLDAQHLLWKLQTGYTLHPDIPIKDDMKIADLGTGTGVWLLDIQNELPKTVHLDGFDISDSQFPPAHTLPAHVHFDVLDALKDLPSALAGKYDVVHLRTWCCVIKGNDPNQLIENANKLLKPGGCLQWEDVHGGRQVIHGDAATRLNRLWESLRKAANIQCEWLYNLPDHLEQHGFSILHYQTDMLKKSLVSMYSNTALLGILGAFTATQENGHGLSLPAIGEIEKLVASALGEVKNGGALHWIPMVVLAKKGCGCTSR